MTNYFGATIASRYDSSSGEEFEPAVIASTAEFLATLAREGVALELGIGTGRVALPLAERGVSVHGIDLSPDMVAQLRKKPGGDAIPVAIGDFATTRVDGTFALVYVVFNTIMNLTRLDRQVACFENVATHLEAGGRFVVEVMIPELRRLPLGEAFVPFDVSREHLGFDEYDTVEQRLVSHHYYPAESRYATFSGRYVWPSELDLMARIAGMTLRERWGGWHREPFDGESRKHISVWAKAA